MNESLQQLETKVENQGATPQGKVSAAEWNVLVAAVKALDSAGINDESLKKYLQQYQYITRPELSGILEDATPDLSGVVTTSGEQDIFGIKNFVNGLKLSNKLIRYDADKNVFVFPANAIFEGGVAWNSSLDGFKPQTVTDAVNVDGVTIGRTTSGALTVLAGAGGGVADSVAWENVTGRPTKLSQFTNDSGFITSSSLPTKLSQLTDDVVTGNYLPINATAANSSKLLGVGLANGNGRNGIPTLSETGYMEVGIAMDFHRYDDGVDFSTRLRVANGNFGNIVWLPTSDGTIALTSDIPTNLSQFTDDVVKGKYLSTSGGTVNGVLSIQSVLQLSDIDNTYKVVLQRDSSGNILFGAGFADSNMYIDADVLRIRSNNTIFSREISTTGLVLRSGSQSATISYNAAKNAFVFPANAIFEGGVAWNTKLDGFDQQTVTAAVSVDETTINRTTSGALQLNPAIAARIAALEARVEQLHPTA